MFYYCITFILVVFFSSSSGMEQSAGEIGFETLLEKYGIKCEEKESALVVPHPSSIQPDPEAPLLPPISMLKEQLYVERTVEYCSIDLSISEAPVSETPPVAPTQHAKKKRKRGEGVTPKQKREHKKRSPLGDFKTPQNCPLCLYQLNLLGTRRQLDLCKHIAQCFFNKISQEISSYSILHQPVGITKSEESGFRKCTTCHNYSELTGQDPAGMWSHVLSRTHLRAAKNKLLSHAAYDPYDKLYAILYDQKPCLPKEFESLLRSLYNMNQAPST